MLKTQVQRQQQRKPELQPQLQPWESRSTLSDSLTGLGARLSRILSLSSIPSSSTLAGDDDSDGQPMFHKTDSAADATHDSSQSRSHSRGRDAFQSSGRGGAGNIRRTSTSRDPALTYTKAVKDGPDDFSQTRGREMNITPAVTHSGRGGAGNIRSPSRGPPSSSLQYEKDLIRHYAERDAELAHSSGRGGAGNISPLAPAPVVAIAGADARSRSRSAVRSSGRGGAGNMVSPTPTTDKREIAKLDELERLKHHQHHQLQHPHDGIHSIGRGGLANFTSAPSPGIELPPIRESGSQSAVPFVISSGRGGAGNIRQTSHSRTRGD